MQMAIPDSYWRQRATEYLVEMNEKLNKRLVPCLEDLMYQIQDEVNGFLLEHEDLENMLRHEPDIAEWIGYRQGRGMGPR